MKSIIRKLWLILVIVLICQSNLKPSYANDPFVTITLKSGLSFQLPENWVVLDQSTKTTLQASVVSRVPIAISSSLPFAASLYDWNEQTIAMINVRVYPDNDVLQNEVVQLNDAEVVQLNDLFQSLVPPALSKIGASVTHWYGTSKQNIHSKIYLRTDYRRTSTFKSDTFFRVTLLRFLSAEKSFTLTLSYDEKHEVLLDPIINRIGQSLQID
jgi:hypothetical protein